MRGYLVQLSASCSKSMIPYQKLFDSLSRAIVLLGSIKRLIINESLLGSFVVSLIIDPFGADESTEKLGRNKKTKWKSMELVSIPAFDQHT